MIAVCIGLPLLFAVIAPGIQRWLLRYPAACPVCAGLTLAACLSLPWTGSALGSWLVPDPLGILVASLACTAWLAASLDTPGAAPPHHAPPWQLAAFAVCLNLAALTDRPEFTVLAAGGAIHAVLLGPGRERGTMLALAGCGLGVAVFGVALLQALQPVPWSALAQAAQQVRGAALGIGAVLVLLGLGCVCLLLPLAAALQGGPMPRQLAILAGPLGAVWLAVALRLRAVLDGNIHAIAPGALLVVSGTALLVTAVLCLWRDPARLVPAGIVAFVGAAAFGFGVGGAAGTAAALLHLTLGCLALTAAGAGGWAGVLGEAALLGLPPLGVFASAYGLLAAAMASSTVLAAVFAALELALVLGAVRRLHPPAERSAPIGWVGLVLTLGASWALPPAVAAWLLGIAAAAR